MQEDIAPPIDALELLAAIHGLQTEVLADDPCASEVFERLLETLLQLTSSEYGFIGERLTSPHGRPYLKTHAITDISWDADSRRFFAENAPDGLEFRNLDTLFGVTLRGDGAVFSDAPAEDPRAGGLPDGHPALVRYLGLPIERSGELLGMIGIANRPGGYDAELVEALAPFCSTCASVLLAWRAQAERRKLEARMIHGERLASLGLLASRVAHDVNNILMGIKGRAHVARMRTGDTIDEQLTGIEDSVDRMAELTRELLTFAGGREHREELLELGRLADDVRVLLELALPPSATLLVTRDSVAPVRGDPAPLRQVLMNFVTNAAEAMLAQGGGEVHVRTLLDDPAAWLHDAFVLGEPPLGRCSVAVVRDHGPGVDPALLETIFDPFVTSKQDGRGLGLAGVPGIVANHDGCVVVRNEPDGGVSFALLLPAAAAAPEPEPSVPVAAGGRVLVFEADPAVRLVTCRVLADQGWLAEGSASVDELLSAAGSGGLSAVILDVGGPSPRGERIYWKLREQAPDLPVVLTTGFADLDVERSLFGQPHAVVLPKPFGGVELAAALARALRSDEPA